MRTLSLLLMLAVVGVGSSTRAQESPAEKPATPPAIAPELAQPLTQEQLVAAIEKVGGAVKRDGDKPDGPVVEVTFGSPGFPGSQPNTDRNKAVSDAMLADLKVFDQLRTLNVWDGTYITDDGIEQLKGLTTLQVLTLQHAMLSDDGRRISKA